MCSIFGFIHNGDVDRVTVQNSMENMSIMTLHRGPDQNGIKCFNNGAIGMNRLSILEPESPRTIEHTAGCYSVLNGEIVNFNDFSNITGSVKCDSRIILPLYLKYGTDFIKQLSGMFAIAVFDSNNCTLHLWRDQLGIKPLYYCVANKSLIFASEIKAIYSVLEKKPSLLFSSLDDILRYRFVQGNYTVFDGIKKVLPGEHLTFKNGEIQSEYYWSLKRNENYYEQSEYEKKNKCQEFRSLLVKIIQQNINTDVDGGFFTSGGLDSSLVTAISLNYGGNKYYQPISIKFTPKSVEDENYGTLLENKFQKKFEWVTITDDLARKTLSEIVKYQDEPLENPTHIGTYLMAERAKELGLKSIITGDGADEFFLGYERQACWEVYPNPQMLYPSLCWTVSPSDADLLYKSDIKLALSSKNYVSENVKNMDEALLDERFGRLSEYHNMRLDKMTMAHGIEARVPFMDKRIAEFSFKLSIKELRNGTEKGFLKEVAKAYLPEEIIFRPKVFFPSLSDQWLRGVGGDWAKEVLLDSSSMLSDYINVQYLEELIVQHISGQRNVGRILWALMTQELWYKNLENWNCSKNKIILGI